MLCALENCKTCSQGRDAASDGVKHKTEDHAISGNSLHLEIESNWTTNGHAIQPFNNAADYYDQLDSEITVAVEHVQQPSSRFVEFLNHDANLMVDSLVGCTSIVVVSRQGAWASHFFESPLFAQDDLFTNLVRPYLHNGRPGGETGTFSLTNLAQTRFNDPATTHIYIMTPANYDLNIANLSPRAKLDSLTDGDHDPQYGPGGRSFTIDASQEIVARDRLTPLEADLRNILPGVPIDKFVYRRGKPYITFIPFGALVVSYSNNQDENDKGLPIEPAPNPQQAKWKCWMQGKEMGSDTWDATPAQLNGAQLIDSPNVAVPPTVVPLDSTPTPATSTEIPSTSATSTDPSSTSTDPSPTSATSTDSTIPYPTYTDTVHAEPYCFEPKRDGYVEYDRKAAANAAAEFCEPGKASLDENEVAGLHRLYDTGAGTTVHSRATWAEDQTDCAPKQRYWFNIPEDKPCDCTFDADYFCAVDQPIADPGMSFGGAFVRKTEEGLCLLLMQYATKNDDDKAAFGVNATLITTL